MIILRGSVQVRQTFVKPHHRNRSLCSFSTLLYLAHLSEFVRPSVVSLGFVFPNPLSIVFSPIQHLLWAGLCAMRSTVMRWIWAEVGKLQITPLQAHHTFHFQDYEIVSGEKAGELNFVHPINIQQTLQKVFSNSSQYRHYKDRRKMKK